MTIKAAFDQGKKNRRNSNRDPAAAPKKVGFFRGWSKKETNEKLLVNESSAMVQTSPEVGADSTVNSSSFKKRKSMVEPGAHIEVSKFGELEAITCVF